MRLTAYTDYALRVLMHLALRKDELVRIAEIAESFDISHNHLTKVVHDLGARGYLATVRGRNGGIRLARPAAEIAVGEVVRNLEPDFRLVECFEPDTSDCRIEPACVLRGALTDALTAFLGRLDEVTLAQLVRPRAKLRSLMGLPVVVTAGRQRAS